MLRLWFSRLLRRPLSPKARSGPLTGRPRPLPVRLEVESLEERSCPSAVVGTGTGLLAQYFTNQTLSGSPALTRIDPGVNFNLPTGTPPAAGLPSSHWSARWTGQVQAQYSQTYTFTALSDDGVRLLVNGQELINDWNDHAPRTDSATIALQAGQKYSIEIDYYQDAYGATAQLAWASPSTPQAIVPTSQLYPALSGTTGLAIDAGGGAVGNFIADTDYTGGSTYNTTAAINTANVTNPAPQAVYQTERYGTFTYTVPNLTPGASYTVRLDFAELYWNAAGQRLFNVAINGQQVLSNFDIFATAGGKDIAVAESFTATANVSGQIVIAFTSVKDNAKVDGIEVAPVLTASGTFIDAGGGAVGNFVADADYSGGSTYNTTAAINTASVTNPAPQAVYQSERFGNFTYTVPNLTPGASYAVRLDFAEVYWNAAGQRLFNVTINGQPVLTDFDIYATAGGKNIAIAETFTVPASPSGQIVIAFTSVKDNAKVSGIEITPVSASDPVAGSNPVSDWFSENLHDAGLAAIARTDDADRQLSRSDMLQLFAYVDKNSTVSATDLADLRTLVANGGFLGMPGYVQDLADKVVNGDPADGTYQGRPLATLAAGSPGWLLQDLVNKWFLGLDLPAVGTGVQYAQASGSLFGSGGPSYMDVVQGSVSDCYFLAGLAEVAYRSPASIESMFINNGDGTYTVRFFNGSQPDYVTVNLQLPEASNGTFEYANFQASLSDAGNKLWVALAEKAYAQLAASGWSRGTGAANAYGSIALGWEGNAIAQLTGQSVSLQALSAASQSAVINAAATGREVGLDTDSSTATGIVPNHVYVLIGYNASTQQFTLYNPWGYVQYLTWAQIMANFGYWSEA